MSAFALSRPPIAARSPSTFGDSEAFPLSVAQYDAMTSSGILSAEDRVELVGGELIRKMSKNGPHSIACRETFRLLDRLVSGAEYFATREDPVRIPDYDEPEPDISIVRGKSRDYTTQPNASRVAMVVEVSDSTLAFDRGRKLLAYAYGGIPIYWIVNLVARQIEVHTEPSGPAGTIGYGRRQVFTAAAQHKVPVLIDGWIVGEVAVADLLP
jgi:Uma2 family endonuclease